jgi:hypothetical protein
LTRRTWWVQESFKGHLPLLQASLSEWSRANGVFELRDGKIVRVSDYFNLADWEKQSGMPPG